MSHAPVPKLLPWRARQSRRNHLGRESPGFITSAAAIAALVTPFNTSLIAVALEKLRLTFGVDTRTSLSLLSAFALASAIALPMGGLLADRFGPRVVMLTGFCIMALGILALLRRYLRMESVLELPRGPRES